MNREEKKKISNRFIGTLGRAIKDKVIPIEEFDINYTPKEITIKKFIDENGKETVDMWYEI